MCQQNRIQNLGGFKMKQLTNSDERKLLSSLWRLTVLWPFLVILSCFSLGFSHLHADEPEVTNENTGQVLYDLSAAIALASPGDTLLLKGTFIGNFLITKSLTLKGKHHATLDGNESGSVLTVAVPTTVLNLEHLRITNGLNTNGGGLLNNGATVNLNHVKIYHNSAAVGGGIFNVQGTIVLDHCKIHNNIANQAGGGVASISGGNIISESKISYNIGGLGGGLYNSQNSATTLNEVKFEGNYAGAFGGAIGNVTASILSVTDSKLKENTAVQFGGGLYNVDGSIANFNDSKIYENNSHIPDGGGGIFSSGATFDLFKTEVVNNLLNDITDI